MLQDWSIIAASIGYVGVLFAIAWFGDRRFRPGGGPATRPLVYALSQAVYCTSWTFFGSVGLASATGYDFIPVYIGPILLFLFGVPLLTRVLRLSKSQNLTSVADFLAARYGKSPAVAAVVTLVAVVGMLPYLALQLKAVVAATETLLGSGPLGPIRLAHLGIFDPAIITTLLLAAFAILFGTRRIDATEHQDGLMLAIAAESVIKLVAFLAVGTFVVITIYGSFGSYSRISSSAIIQDVFGRTFSGGTWLTVTFLSFCAMLLLPRQFYVGIVANNDESELKTASWLFPLYLVLINIFVVPIAAAGLALIPRSVAEPDMFVLALPVALGSDTITTLAFIGGLSAATAMVIVESIALAIMICNGFVVPVLLRQRVLDDDDQADIAGRLLVFRRIAIFAIILASYGVYRLLGHAEALAAIGLVSFAAVAQMAPAFFFGLIWRKGTARGAIAGILAGFVVWAYTLLLPWIAKAHLIPQTILTDGPLGIAFLRPQALFFLEFEPLTHGVLWSMAANIAAYVMVSLLRPPEPIERLQAHVFVLDEPPRASPMPAFRLWRTSITIADLQSTVARYLGAERAERSFVEYAASRASPLVPHAEADVHVLRFTEHLLASAIGAASARLVLSLLLRRSNVGSPSALKLLDDASEALQYNRDLLQSALDQVRHGLGVFDKDMRLVTWNRQFRELLGLPPELGRVGMPLDRILRACAERGDFGEGPIDELVADRLMRLAVTKETYQERTEGGRRILEIRTSPMPQGGIVTTFSDITDRVAAAQALARANETLERRVRDRTAELMDANRLLEAAKAKADAANLEKTRFLAAASHDILQPLNAARLYTTSLVERQLQDPEAGIARNIDASLSAVEEILGALIDISRMDAGRIEPEFSDVPLQDLFASLAVEYEPIAQEKKLSLRIVETSAWVRADRKLLRRVLQNLVSNAVKYTRSGKVLLGVRRRDGRIVVEVHDTGPGIPSSQQTLIFKEFQRLDQSAGTARGLGLGLSIVERIGKVLEVPVSVRSKVGRGSMFAVALREAAGRAAEPAASTPAGRPLASLKGCRVLCVDNEPAVLAGMETLLAGWGCEILVADSTRRAVEVVTRAHTIPDVLIVDYHLDRGTGIDTVAAVRTLTARRIPAIVVTADHSPEVQRELRDGDFLQLRKPLKAAALRAALTRYARRGPLVEAAQ